MTAVCGARNPSMPGLTCDLDPADHRVPERAPAYQRWHGGGFGGRRYTWKPLDAPTRPAPAAQQRPRPRDPRTNR